MGDSFKRFLAISFVLIIAVCAITIADTVGRTLRADLTHEKLYTLSEGTKDIIRAVNQPVTLKLYYARTAALKGPEFLRKYNNYYLYVRDLLREYERLSGGLIRLDVIDPRPDTDEEMDAVRYGLQRYAIGEESFFFGLAVVTEFGQERALPFLTPNRQELIEYEVSSAIYSSTTRTKKRVGILSGPDILGVQMSDYLRKMLEMQGKVPPEPWRLANQLRSLYEIVAIPKDAETIEGIDILLVIHPKALPDPEKTFFAIDQYVMNGGKLIAFVDPYCVVDTVNSIDRSSDMNRLLAVWGCEMKSNAFAADRRYALTIEKKQGESGEVFLPLMGIGPEGMNTEDIITAKAREVRFLFAGGLKVAPPQGVKAETLIATSEKGNYLELNPTDFGMGQIPDGEVFLKRFIEGSEPIVLACKLTGRFASAFPEGLKFKENKGNTKNSSEEIRKGLTEAREETTVIVFSDVDMVNDFVAFQESLFGLYPSADNISILMNAIENLTGSRALMNARSKGKFSRPFTVLDAIEKEAEEKTARQVAAVEGEIARYEVELNKMQGSVTEENAVVLQREVLSKKRELEGNLLAAKRQLRDLNREKRLKIESIVMKLKLINMTVAPSIILFLAGLIYISRFRKRRRFRRMAS